MNIEEGIRAALAAVIRVDDSQDLNNIAGPLNLYKSNCKYLEFIEPENNHVFQSDTVHVVTKTQGRASNSVRRLSKTDGREVFNVPTLLLQSAGELSALNVKGPEDSMVTFVAPSLSKTLGTLLCDMVESHALMPLLASAEAQGSVVKTSVENVQEVCDREVDKLAMQCTIILHYQDVDRIGAHIRSSIGSSGLGQAAPTRAIGEGVILIVANDSKRVGFITENDDVQAVVVTEAGFMIKPTAFVRRGFGVWGDAPIVKIDTRT